MSRTRSGSGCLPTRLSPAWLDAEYGRYRRRQGRYDTFTLACLRRAWQRQPSLRTLLGYLGGRRACGRPPSVPLLAALGRRLAEAHGRDLHLALNLLLEGGTGHAWIPALDPAVLPAAAAHSPPLAHALRQSGLVLDDAAGALADLQASQAAWRGAFADWLAAVRGSVCVVGNAGTLANAGLGARIDAHRGVVRFNRYHSPATRREDTGVRIDAWVCTPEIAGTALPAQCPADWLVLSGCDVRYQLYHWEQLLPFLAAGGRILTVPRTTWHHLVDELKAPPSAGVLLLAWLVELQGVPAGITVAGFQSDRHPAASSRRYHYAAPGQRAGHRHNWPGEQCLLRQWQARGLSVLEPA